MDFDETRLYYSHQQLHQRQTNDVDDAQETDADRQVVMEDEEAQVPKETMRRHFREFFRKSLYRSYVYISFP